MIAPQYVRGGPWRQIPFGRLLADESTPHPLEKPLYPIQNRALSQAHLIVIQTLHKKNKKKIVMDPTIQLGTDRNMINYVSLSVSQVFNHVFNLTLGPTHVKVI